MSHFALHEFASRFGWAASRTKLKRERGEGDASYRRSAAGVVGLGRWASRIRHGGATVDRGSLRAGFENETLLRYMERNVPSS